MPLVQLSFKPKAVSKKLLNTLNPRTREVIVKRYGLDNKERKTLESIGKEYNITRERVRQIENFALNTIRKSKDFKEMEMVFDELGSIIKNLGSLVPENALMETISNDEVVHNHVNFFLTLSPHFIKHREDDHFCCRWSVDPKISEAVHNALSGLHKNIDKDELIKEEEIISRFLTNLSELTAEYKEDSATIKKYLQISKVIDKNPFNEWGHVTSPAVKARGIKDFAYLILRRAGTPMHFRDVAKEINTTFNKRAHVATCHNELIKDSRFVLVGRGMYGLKEWGHTGGVVRDIIIKILSQEGGEPLHKDHIVRDVMAVRNVKANTILVNLQNPKYFKKLDGGYYALA